VGLLIGLFSECSTFPTLRVGGKWNNSAPPCSTLEVGQRFPYDGASFSLRCPTVFHFVSGATCSTS